MIKPSNKAKACPGHGELRLISKWPATDAATCGLLTIFFVAALCLPSAHAAEPPMDPVQASIKRLLTGPAAMGADRVGGDSIGGMAMLPLVYRGRAYRPFWIDAQLRLEAAKALIEAIGRAGEDGLDPLDYHLATIYRLLADTVHEPSTVHERLAELDLILSDAFLLLGSHLLIGKVNPETLSTHWKIDPGRGPLLPLLEQAATTGDVDSALNALRPSHDDYTRLRNALARLRALAARGGWPMLNDHLTLRPGDRHADVADLRRRLDASGDLAPQGGTDDPRRFDATLAAAVKRFQRRHGVAEDGVVGPNTLGMLNVPVEKRIRQAEINLERWRWLPRHLGRRFVMVNTAAFTLSAVEAGQVALAMRVVVGRPARRSPVFSSSVSYLVVNPFWTIPTTIAVEDVLPAVQKDPAYLTERGIRVFATWQADAPEIDPADVDWRAYHADQFPFTLRQDPGPRNALGRIKFMFPNEFAVYLHDTPDHTLFERVQRDLSSGCIRVQSPLALADFVLAGDGRWTFQDVKQWIENGDTVRVSLGHPVPVHLLYMTAWADKWGMLQFRRDIYHRDGLLDHALKQPRPRPPVTDAPDAFQ